MSKFWHLHSLKYQNFCNSYHVNVKVLTFTWSFFLNILYLFAWTHGRFLYNKVPFFRHMAVFKKLEQTNASNVISRTQNWISFQFSTDWFVCWWTAGSKFRWKCKPTLIWSEFQFCVCEINLVCVCLFPFFENNRVSEKTATVQLRKKLRYLSKILWRLGLLILL